MASAVLTATLVIALLTAGEFGVPIATRFLGPRPRAVRRTLPLRHGRRRCRLAWASLVALALAQAGCGGEPISPRASAPSAAALVGTPAFVQAAYKVPQTGQVAVAVAYAKAQVAGDVNVVVAGWSDSTAAVTSVTDTKGNAYALAVGPTVRAGCCTQSIYYAKNVAAAAAGANTVTVRFGSAARYADIRILEYAGLDAASPVDVVAAASGSGTLSDSGPATTRVAGALLLGANTVATGTTGAGSGYTSRVLSVPDGDIVEDRVATVAGAYRATAPLSSSGGWVMQMVAFRPAVTAAPDTQAPTAPTNLSALPATSGQVDLSWNASVDDVGVAGYLLERCSGVGCSSFVQVASPAGTSFSDTGLAASTTYGYRLRATDGAANLSAYSAVAYAATPAPSPSPFPLAVSGNGRYVVDRDGQPFRLQADAAWVMPAAATPAQVDTYLATRRAQGFNSFYMMAMVRPGGYPGLAYAGTNYNGISPFTNSDDFATVREAYWTFVDTIVDKAAVQDMAVMLAYTYLGYQGGWQGWAQQVLAQPSREACRSWGLWLGNRYKNRPNVIWFALGDYTPPAGSELEARTLAIIAGIKASGAGQVFMAEPTGGDSNPILDAPAFASVLDLNSFYGYGPNGSGDCYGQAERAYRATPAKPAWVQEGGYEFETNTGGFTGQPFETRRTRLWAVLAGGSAGDGFGSRDVYQWADFPACLSTPGAAFSKVAFDLFAGVSWWDLRPSGIGTGFAGRTLVTAGGGTKGAMDWVTSAVNGDGTTLMAYIPTTGGTGARTITVDMAAMSGPARARWWDPASGAYTLIGTGYANSGTRSFTSPGTNGGGQNDWVLLLGAGGN
jgi:hypothetical protein